MLNVLPLNMMAIAMGLHVRCGIEDNIWTQDRKAKMGTVKQIEQLVRISREFGREVANGKEARQIYRIGEFYKSADETLAKNGFAPNRQPAPARLPAARLSARRDSSQRVSQPPSSSCRGCATTSRSTGRPCSKRACARPAGRCASVPPMGREDLDCAARVRGHRARGAGHRRADRDRRAQRRLHHAGPLGAADAARRCTARCWPRRRTSSGRCPRATRRWTRCAPAAGCRCRARGCPSRASSPASRNDPLARLRARRRTGARLGQPTSSTSARSGT